MPTIRRPPTTIKYSVHPLALDVFHFMSNRYHPIFRWDTFPDPLKKALLQQQMYTGIMHSERIPKPNRKADSEETQKRDLKFEFITPVWALKYTEQVMPLPDNYLVCYEPDELTDHQISLMSWSSIFQLLAFSVDRRKLALVRDALNELVPTAVMHDLLSTKSLTIDALAEWTGGSRGTIVYQKKKQQTHTETSESYSEEQLLRILTGQAEA